MGDRWVDHELFRSTYVWLPLAVEGANVTLRNREAWELPRMGGGGAGGAPGREWEFKVKENARLSNNAKILANGAVGYVGGPDNGTILIQTKAPVGRGSRNTWRIYYRNGDKATRHASVQFGSKAPSQKVAFLPTGGQIGISVITTSSENTSDIVISGWKGSWGPDIVRLKTMIEG